VTKVLLATDADWLRDEVAAALADADTTVQRVHKGEDVLATAKHENPSLVVLDMQIGNMGGMATCRALHHAHGAGELDDVATLLLLDRDADIFLAQQADADGWLVKPIDAFRLRRAATALLAGETYQEASAAAPAPEPEVVEDDAADSDGAEPDSDAG
jgi:DNA-binding response OmpR family regulator